LYRYRTTYIPVPVLEQEAAAAAAEQEAAVDGDDDDEDLRNRRRRGAAAVAAILADPSLLLGDVVMPSEDRDMFMALIAEMDRTDPEWRAILVDDIRRARC
jgi:hypothetical protein